MKQCYLTKTTSIKKFKNEHVSNRDYEHAVAVWMNLNQIRRFSRFVLKDWCFVVTRCFLRVWKYMFRMLS